MRPARQGDLAALTAIYNHWVTASACTFDVRELTLAERRAWLDAHGDAGPHRVLVAEADGAVLGYASSGPLRPKPAYATSVETSVYVAPGREGRGLGRALYGALFRALAGEDLHRAYAGVVPPNPASVALHAAFGFRSLGVFREVGRKHGRYWDVEWFEKELG